MKIRISEGVAGDSSFCSTHIVADNQSIVFLTPSVMNPVLHARFYDDQNQLHQVPADRILSIDPDDPPRRLPVRYIDPETGAEVPSLEERVARLERDTVKDIRLGPRTPTPEERAADAKKFADRLTEQITRDAAIAKDVQPVDRTKLCTTNGQSPEEVRANQKNETGQHAGYIVLCEEERQKGFVRQYRDAYKHVGRSICGVVVGTEHGFRTICDEEDLTHVGEHGCVTRRVTVEQQKDIEYRHLIGGCGAVTTMGRALSETYQRDPGFYHSTFCVTCNKHLPVAEFIWTADGERVGS
jgi:hypothetical protein